jgi:xylulokinase
MRDEIEIMRQMNLKFSQTRATGGGAKSKFWLQLQADVFDQTMVLTNSTEGGCFGVALLAGVGAGVWSSVEQACEATIRLTSRVKPVAKQVKHYDRCHAVYAKLYGDLKHRFPELAALAE